MVLLLLGSQVFLFKRLHGEELAGVGLADEEDFAEGAAPDHLLDGEVVLVDGAVEQRRRGGWAGKGGLPVGSDGGGAKQQPIYS